MKEIMKKPIAWKRRSLAALITAVLVLLTGLPLAEAVSAAEATVTVRVPQSFVTNSASADGTFAYKVTRDSRTPSAPLPTGTGSINGSAYEYTTKDNNFEDIKFTFTAPGPYYYELECTTPDDREEYTLDKRVYIIEITVAANMSPVTVAYDKSNRKDKTDPAYAHKYYVPPPKDPPKHNEVTIEKVLLDPEGKKIEFGYGDVFTVVLKRNETVAYTFTLNRGNNFSERQIDLSTGTYSVEETAATGGLGIYDTSYSGGNISVSETSTTTVTVTNKLKVRPPDDPEGPHITIDKRADKTTAGPRQPVTYTLEITSTGEEALKDIVVSDNMLRGYTGAITVALKRAGSSTQQQPLTGSKYTFSRSAGTLSGFIEPNTNNPLTLNTDDKLFISYTVSFEEEGEYDNTAIVTGTGVDSDEDVQDQDSLTVNVVDEYVELDDDGTPLGIWRWDPETGTWIYEEFPPLANLPQTGQLRWPVPALTALGALLFIIGFALNRRRARNERRMRRESLYTPAP
jgi:hypothetical protein